MRPCRFALSIIASRKAGCRGVEGDPGEQHDCRAANVMRACVRALQVPYQGYNLCTHVPIANCTGSGPSSGNSGWGAWG